MLRGARERNARERRRWSTIIQLLVAGYRTDKPRQIMREVRRVLEDEAEFNPEQYADMIRESTERTKAQRGKRGEDAPQG